MSKKRYFIKGKMDTGDTVSTADPHIRVMRHSVGDEVVLFNGDGYDYAAKVFRTSNKSTEFLVGKKTLSGAVCPVRLTVLCALVKGDGNETQVQKCSELGAAAFVPFVSKNTVVTMNTNRAERLRRIAEESGKQCRRSALMDVQDVMTFSEALMAAEGSDLKLFAYEKEDKQGIYAALQAAPAAQSAALVIGCEGGFTPEEAEKAVRAGFQPVSLGKTILKADTAAIAGAAAVLCCLGAFNP